MNLPHAARIASRLRDVVERHPVYEELEPAFVDELDELMLEVERPLLAVAQADENPPPADAARLAENLADSARRLVAALEDRGVRSDRLGQCVRNFFECLERGEEGAIISLRAGENPDSAQRPC